MAAFVGGAQRSANASVQLRTERREEAGDRVEPPVVAADATAGMQRRSPTVYGWRGSERTVSTGPSSHRPA
jgi:hypothetical protein